MPEAFDRCVKNGGKVRTQSLSGGRFRKVCIMGGKTFAGHIQKKKGTKIKRHRKAQPTSKQVGKAFMSMKT